MEPVQPPIAGAGGERGRGLAGESVLGAVGEDVVRIVFPVSLCMLLVVALVTYLPPYSGADIAGSISDAASSSGWSPIWAAAVTAAIFVVAVTAATFLIFGLFYLGCTRCLRFYMFVSSFLVLLFLGGHVSLLAISDLGIPIDAASFAVLLVNVASVAAFAVFVPRAVPFAVNQVALVVIAVLTAYWFAALLPEWTAWVLLVAMALYDLAAVLLPGGPLRLLLELAIARNVEIPALVYEARPVDPRPDHRQRLWQQRPGLDVNSSANLPTGGAADNLRPLIHTRREETGDIEETAAAINSSNGSIQSAASVSGEGSSTDGPNFLVTGQSRKFGEILGETPADSATIEVPPQFSEMATPLIQPRQLSHEEEEDADGPEGGIGLSSSGAIKLGLGDFIFYSVLVGRAAMYDFMTVYACYLAIIAGLGITLLLLAFYRKALPALPVSVTLGVVFYLLTRGLLEMFAVQCSASFLMF